jgi:ribose 5-phosphate isomerase B
MRIVLGSDEETAVVDSLVAHLETLGHEVTRVGIGAEWPEVGQLVAGAVASSAADRGVVCCYTGTGVAIAANKVPGVRAALCTDAATAAGARRWNDANVLALGLRLLSPVVGGEILDAFLTSDPDDDAVEAVRRLESSGSPA